MHEFKPCLTVSVHSVHLINVFCFVDASVPWATPAFLSQVSGYFPCSLSWSLHMNISCLHHLWFFVAFPQFLDLLSHGVHDQAAYLCFSVCIVFRHLLDEDTQICWLFVVFGLSFNCCERCPSLCDQSLWNKHKQRQKCNITKIKLQFD